MVVTLERAQAIAKEWAEYMEIEPCFDVQVGDLDAVHPIIAEARAEAEVAADGHAWACTIGNPENTQFIIAIRPDTPEDRLEHIIVHELVHVYTFRQCGDDERANMELATDQLARMIQQYRKLEAANA